MAASALAYLAGCLIGLSLLLAFAGLVNGLKSAGLRDGRKYFASLGLIGLASGLAYGALCIVRMLPPAP